MITKFELIKNLAVFRDFNWDSEVLKTNEYSHLAGSFERGANPIDAPEMKQVATLIIARLREDSDQFDAFLSSIGETEGEQLTEDMSA